VSSEVRRIRADEGLQLRVLRLRALAYAPMAFGSTLAREEAFSEHVWHERAVEGASGTDRVTFIAEREGQWLGLATGVASDPIKPDDRGPVLVGMFVDPAARGRGLGAALVEAVVAWARSRGATWLSLWVTSSNGPAIALYEKCGFQRTGDSQPLAHSPAVAEFRMVRELR
jgi:GNAT superfamily N-acetyltransferase